MKTIMIALTIAITLLGTKTASAQDYYTLPEIKEQSLCGWHETYSDEYGRSINVDIEIDVFGNESAPVLLVGFPAYKEYRIENNSPFTAQKHARLKRGGQTTRIYESSSGVKIELDRKYAENYGSTLTPQNVYDYMGELLNEQGITIDQFLYEQPKSVEILCSTSKKSDELLVPAFYVISLWQKLYELPILTHVNDSYFNRATVPSYMPSALFQMRNTEEFSLFVGTFVEKEVIQQDIPLCSVDQVIENAGEEIMSGHIQSVISLRFGYAVYNDPEISAGKPMTPLDVENWYLVPSWILECYYSKSPKSDYREDTSPKLVVFNAQTGKMVDPMDKSYRGCGDPRYRDFISWNDVR